MDSLTFCIVDDEREVCDILRLFFESRGHRCLMAHDGEAGLALIRAVRPAAAFLDVAMPRMNGLEVLTELRQDPETANIPVLMMTGMTHESTTNEAEWAKASGASAFLSKPFNFDQLLEMVEKITQVKA